ncbi:MAG: YkvA family protein [Caldilineaceae bacterium]
MQQWKKAWQRKVKLLKSELFALYLAYRDPRTPFYARLFAACVVAYAFSPIDLIPDFIPVLGYLDDLVLVPLGIALAMRLIPPPVLAESRAKAQELVRQGKPVSRTAAVVIVSIWVLGAGLGIFLIVRFAMSAGLS